MAENNPFNVNPGATGGMYRVNFGDGTFREVTYDELVGAAANLRKQNKGSYEIVDLTDPEAIMSATDGRHYRVNFSDDTSKDVTASDLADKYDQLNEMGSDNYKIQTVYGDVDDVIKSKSTAPEGTGTYWWVKENGEEKMYDQDEYNAMMAKYTDKPYNSVAAIADARRNGVEVLVAKRDDDGKISNSIYADMYQVSIPDQESQIMSATDFAAQRDSIYAENPGVQVTRFWNYKPGKDDGQDVEYYVYRTGAKEPETYTKEELDSIYADLKAQDPGVKVIGTKPDDYQEQQSISAKQALDAFDAEHSEEISKLKASYNTDESRIKAGTSPKDQAWYDRHEAEGKRLDDLSKQREDLVKAFENTDYQRRLRAAMTEQNDQLAAQANEESKKYTQAESQQMMYYRAAQHYLEAKTMWDAPSVADTENTFLKNMGKGAKDAALDPDFWTMGLQDLGDAMLLRNITKRLKDQLSKDGKDIEDCNLSDIDKYLKPDESALLKAWLANAKAQAARASGLGRGYTAGQTAAESAIFMAQFLLSGNAAGAIGRKISKTAAKEAAKTTTKKTGRGLAGWIGRALAEGNEAAIRAMGMKAGEKLATTGAKSMLGNALLKAVGRSTRAMANIYKYTARPVTQGIVHTVLQPATYKDIAEKLLEAEYSDDVVSQGKVIWQSVLDSFIENWSESSGFAVENAISGMFKLGGKALKIGDRLKLGEMTPAQWGKFIAESGPMKIMHDAGFNGFIGEMGEEWLGNAARVLTNQFGMGGMTGQEFMEWGGGLLQKKDKELRAKAIENQIDMAASFAPMSLIGLGSTSVAAYKQSMDYLEIVEKMKPILNEVGGLTADEVNQMFSAAQTRDQLKEKIVPVVEKILAKAKAGDKQAISSIKDVMKFVQQSELRGVMFEAQNYYEQTQREYLDDQIRSTLGATSADDDRGIYTNNAPVRNADGTTRYEEHVTVMTNSEGQWYVIDTGGSQYLLKKTDGSVSKAIGKKDYDRQIANGKMKAETKTKTKYLAESVKRMEEEQEAKRQEKEAKDKRAALLQRIQADPEVDFGRGKVGQVVEILPEGVHVHFDSEVEMNGKRGQDHIVSYEEVGNAVNIDQVIRTKEEQDKAKAQQIREDRQRENTINGVAKGKAFNLGDQVYTFQAIKNTVHDEETGDTFFNVIATDKDGNTTTVQIEKDYLEEQVKAMVPVGDQESGSDAAERVITEERLNDRRPRDFRGNLLPLKADGSVDEAALWKNDKEAWFRWNDARRGGDTANSISKLDKLMAAIPNKLAELEQQYDMAAVENDFDASNRLEGEISALQQEIEEYTKLRESYNMNAEQMDRDYQFQQRLDRNARMLSMATSDEQKAKLTEERRDLFQEYLGEVITDGTQFEACTMDDLVQTIMADATRKGADAVLGVMGDINEINKAMTAGVVFPGVYLRSVDKIYFVADYIRSVDEARTTAVHEHQHKITYESGLDLQLAQKVSREECIQAVQAISGTSFYDDKKDDVVADEVISHCMEVIVNNSNLSVEEALTAAGVTGKNLINFINNLENEQRESENNLLAARRNAHGSSRFRVRGTENGTGESAGSTEVGGEGSGPSVVSETGQPVVGVRFSVVSIADAAGLRFGKMGNATIFRDKKTGKVVGDIDADFIAGSDLGKMIQAAADNGFIGSDDVRKQCEFFANIFTMMQNTQDVDLIWGVSGAFGFQPLTPDMLDEDGMYILTDADKQQKFAATTDNSDPQYSTTVDFTTICLKTQAVIDVMSRTMVEEKRGLTREEIVNIVFNETHKAGEPVPCPVCYVFSRWVLLGKLLGTMKNLQDKYDGVDQSALQARLAELDAQIIERLTASTGEERTGFSSKELAKVVNTIGNEKNKLADMYSQLTSGNEYLTVDQYYKLVEDIADQLKLESRKAINKKLILGSGLVSELENSLAQLEADLEVYNEYSWLKSVRMDPEYETKGKVDEDILFDINRGLDFATQYPVAWTFRTTRGSALGKAAAPYSPLKLGQVVTMVGTNTENSRNDDKNPFLSKTATDKERHEMFVKAIAKARIQNLRNGQRWQSTSDFRFEYALDYILGMLEMQAVGSKVQLYTKVPEAVPLLASMGAECNCSLMAMGDGIADQDYYWPDGTIRARKGDLIFSNITGMDDRDAKMLYYRYNNVQPIIVGISEDHIRKCMQSDWITFIIPFHASGGTDKAYRSMMDTVGESVVNRTDYEAYQGDKIRSDATPQQKRTRDLRSSILSGVFIKTELTDQDRQDIKENKYLNSLYERFYGQTVDGQVLEQDKDCYHAFYSSADAKLEGMHIMPFEYWDYNSVYKTTYEEGDVPASVNNARFLEYCDSLGVTPRFSGFNSDGKYDASFDFTNEEGYWKVLIDRRMYNNDGSYHYQKPINITDADATYFTGSEGEVLQSEMTGKEAKEALRKARTVGQGIVNPSRLNSPEKVADIVRKVRSRIDNGVEFNAALEQILADESAEAAAKLSEGLSSGVYTMADVEVALAGLRKKCEGLKGMMNKDSKNIDDALKLEEKLEKQQAKLDALQAKVTIAAQNLNALQMQMSDEEITVKKYNTLKAKEQKLNDALATAISKYEKQAEVVASIEKDLAENYNVTSERAFDIVDGKAVLRGSDSGLRAKAVSPEIAAEMEQIKATARVNGTFMKAPNGNDTNLTEDQWAAVRTRKFKDWFGDWENDPENASKVVDENGEPMVVYHGTRDKFNTFEKKNGKRWTWGISIDVEAQGFFFAFDEKIANDIAEYQNGRVVPVFLNARSIADMSEGDGTIYSKITGENPFEAHGGREGWWDILDNIDGDTYGSEAVAKAKEMGYDAMMFAEEAIEGKTISKSIAVFDANQIKSATDNNGEFGNSDDIRFKVKPFYPQFEDVRVTARAYAILSSKLYDYNDQHRDNADMLVGLRIFEDSVEKTDRGTYLCENHKEDGARVIGFTREFMSDEEVETIVSDIENGTYTPGPLADKDIKEDWHEYKWDTDGVLVLEDTGAEKASGRVDVRPGLSGKSRGNSTKDAGYQQILEPTEAVSKAFNVNDKTQAFTEQIFAKDPRDRKTIETRDSRSLDSLIGKRVAVISTGTKGGAKVVGYVTVQGVKQYNTVDDFRKDYRKHKVKAGSKYDFKGVKYGYKLVDPVREENPYTPSQRGNVIRNAFIDDRANIRFRTSTEIEAEYPNWMDNQVVEEGKKGQSTQVAGTVGTYKKVGEWIKNNLHEGASILDASSGMGLGTQALREMGFDVEDVEPYPSSERMNTNTPTYTSYSDITKKYDYVISNAVLNVIPDDWRADVLYMMGQHMADGGKMFINTRKAGEEKTIKNKIELDNAQEVLVGTPDRINSYQKFYTVPELIDYVKGILGDGYTVVKANKANSGTDGLAAVVVTKSSGAARFKAVDAKVTSDDAAKVIVTEVDGRKESYARNSKYGVGKDMMGKVYFHKDYMDDILPDGMGAKVREIAEKNGIEYKALMYDPKKPELIRYDEAPDFDTAREPHPGRQQWADVSTMELVGKQRNEQQIWHHKWMWVKDDYQGFDVNESYEWSKQWLEKIANPSGWRGKWEDALAEAGLPTNSGAARFSAKKLEDVNKEYNERLKDGYRGVYDLGIPSQLLRDGGIDGEMRITGSALEHGRIKHEHDSDGKCHWTQKDMEDLPIKLSNAMCVIQSYKADLKNQYPMYLVILNETDPNGCNYAVAFHRFDIGDKHEWDARSAYGKEDTGLISFMESGTINSYSPDLLKWIEKKKIEISSRKGPNALSTREKLDSVANIIRKTESATFVDKKTAAAAKKQQDIEVAVTSYGEVIADLSGPNAAVVKRTIVDKYIPDALKENGVNYVLLEVANISKEDADAALEFVNSDNVKLAVVEQAQKNASSNWIAEHTNYWKKGGTELRFKVAPSIESVSFRAVDITPETRAEMDVIEATARINGTYLKAPNGKDTNLNAEQWAVVRTKAFKDWFGDWENDPGNASKVVDENGEPKVMYHGSPSSFTKFNTYEGDGFADLGMGTYFTDMEEVAKTYMRPNGDNQWQIDNFIENSPYLLALSQTNLGLREAEKIAIKEIFKNAKLYPAFLNIRNPYMATMEDFDDEDGRFAYEDDSYRIRRKYDGIIDRTATERFKDFMMGGYQVVAFESNQIKSATDNNGEFSSRNNDIRFRFIGEQGARNLDDQIIKADLAVAKQMKAEKKDAKTIKVATGWEQGRDGKWKYEQPDFKVNQDVTFTEDDNTKKLGDLLDANDGLFKEYPQFRDINVTMVSNLIARGQYDPATDSISINQDRLEESGEGKYKIGKDAYSTLAHEVQHAIQKHEGFALGGNSRMEKKVTQVDIDVKQQEIFELRRVMNALTTSIRNLMMKYNAEEAKLLDTNGEMPTDEKQIAKVEGLQKQIEDIEAQREKFRKEYDELAEELRNMNSGKIGDLGYKRLAGEVESRNVQARIGMTPEERRNTLAAETEDVPRGKQTVRFKVATKQDEEYMAAVEAGDMEKAQAMVDEAARAAGYTYKGYHGTNAIFNVFDPEKLGSKNWLAPSAAMGFFASASKKTAEAYTGLNSLDSMSVHLNDEAHSNMERIKEQFNYAEAEAKEEENRARFEEQYKAEHGYKEEVDDMVDLAMETLTPMYEAKGASQDDINQLRERLMITWASSWNSKVPEGEENNNINLMNWAYEDTPEHKEFVEFQDKVFKAWEDTEIKRLGYQPNVKDLYIKLENPLVHDFKGEGRDAESFAARMAKAKEEGRDGCIFENVEDGGELDTIYAVFNNTQLKSASPVTFDDKGELIPLSERFNPKSNDIRFKATTKQDADYMKAVEAGDMEKAQAMVDAAAESSMADSQVRDDAGKLLHVYHGTNADKKFWIFDTYNSRSNGDLGNVGSHFGPKGTAKEFSKDNLYDVYLNMKKVYEAPFDFFADNYNNAYLEVLIDLKNSCESEEAHKVFERIYDVYPFLSSYDLDDISVAEEFDGDEVLEEMETRTTKSGMKYRGPKYLVEHRNAMVEIMRDMMEAEGFDGISYDNWYEGEFENKCYVALYPSQIKSADPVTYDDNGNVIPLSERFSTSEDIRFSVRPATEAKRNGVDSVLGVDGFNDLLVNAYDILPDDLKDKVVNPALGMPVEATSGGMIQVMSDLAEKDTLTDEEKDFVKEMRNRMRTALGDDKLSNNELLWIMYNEAHRNDEEFDERKRGQEVQRKLGQRPSVTGRRVTLDDVVKAKGSAAIDVKDQFDAYEKIIGQINDIKQAVKARRKYDRITVGAITDLAEKMLDAKMFSNARSSEIREILDAIESANGLKNITGKINDLFDTVIDNYLRNLSEQFDKVMKSKAVKVTSKKVTEQGTLDIQGQEFMDAFRRGAKMMSSDNGSVVASQDLEDIIVDYMQSVADGHTEDQHKLFAYLLAQRYIENVAHYENELDALNDQEDLMKRALKEGAISKEAYDGFVESNRATIESAKIDKARGLAGILQDMIDVTRLSHSKAIEFLRSRQEHASEILHNANSDMQGISDKQQKDNPTAGQMLINGLSDTILAPLGTFDQMLRLFGNKSVNGEGYLWNRFMRGWIDATGNEFAGTQARFAEIDAKVSQVLGKKMRWSDLYRWQKNKPTLTIEYTEGVDKSGNFKKYTKELGQGQMLYIYLVSQMEDGKMKLSAMNISDTVLDQIKKAIDPKVMELGRWMVDEFLPSCRKDYNEIHERLFGAPMDSIENYFPIKINADSRSQKQDASTAGDAESNPSNVTGSIMKRVRNVTAIDLNADAFSVIVEHIQNMEHWAAFAEWNTDISTLISSTKFRNQVKHINSVYGAGEAMWKNFVSSVRVAAGSYKPKTSRHDKQVMNVAGAVTAAKISLRVFTALKQFMSYPAYLAEANPLWLAKSTATPWESWNWAMENLPVFQKRWKSRQAGDHILKATDNWRSHLMEVASRIGMTPNAAVDALTVSIGAYAIYKSKYDKYIRFGFSPEKADKRAKQDAVILYNETQQSNENAFLSTIQLDRTVVSSAFTVFRNSSMGYQRQLHDALRGLARRTKKGYKESSIDFMAKQAEREGLSPADARRYAEMMYRRQGFKDVVRVAIFAYGMQLAWNLGSYLPYVIFGDDDETRGEFWKDVFIHSLFGGVEGLAGGSIMSEGLSMLSQGKSFKEWNPTLLPIVADFDKLIKEFGKDWVVGLNELINLASQLATGVNIQTIEDIVVAAIDAANGDLGFAKESMFFAMRVLQIPQSQIEKLWLDEVNAAAKDLEGATPAELVERYSNYKFNRKATLTRFLYSDVQEDEAMSKLVGRYGGDSAENLADNEVNEIFFDVAKEVKDLNKKETKLRKLYEEGSDAARQELLDIASDPSYGKKVNMARAYDEYNDLMKKAVNADNREEMMDYLGKADELKEKIVRDYGENQSAEAVLRDVYTQASEGYLPIMASEDKKAMDAYIKRTPEYKTTKAERDEMIANAGAKLEENNKRISEINMRQQEIKKAREAQKVKLPNGKKKDHMPEAQRKRLIAENKQLIAEKKKLNEENKSLQSRKNAIVKKLAPKPVDYMDPEIYNSIEFQAYLKVKGEGSLSGNKFLFKDIEDLKKLYEETDDEANKKEIAQKIRIKEVELGNRLRWYMGAEVPDDDEDFSIPE